jgi:hypothetical protein
MNATRNSLISVLDLPAVGPPRETHDAPRSREGSAQAEVRTAHWFVVGFLLLGMFAAAVIVTGAEIWN